MPLFNCVTINNSNIVENFVKEVSLINYSYINLFTFKSDSRMAE